MFELTHFAVVVLLFLFLGFFGWLIFGDFRIRDFSLFGAASSVWEFVNLLVRAPSLILVSYDEVAPRRRLYLAFSAAHFPIPFLGFPLQLLYIPQVNAFLFMLWGSTWIVHLFSLETFYRGSQQSESAKLSSDSMEAWWFSSFFLGLLVSALFDPNQLGIALGEIPYDATPFSSSIFELLIAAFFLLPYLGFVGYLVQRHFFLKEVERQKIDDQALVLVTEGYSMAGTMFKPARKKTLTKTIEIDLWKNLFPGEWIVIQGERRSLHQLNLKVTVQDWGTQFEMKHVFDARDHGWKEGRRMTLFDPHEYYDYERMLVETMNQYHPLELQRRLIDREEDIKAHYVDSGRAEIYELLLSTI